MKSLKALIITILCMIPTLISATVVRVGKWQRPNGTSILVVSDVHFPSQNESMQRDDFIDYLKDYKSSYVLAEDPCALGVPQEYCPSSFIPGIVESAQSKSIAARSIEFRKGRCGLDRNKIMAHIDFLRSKHSEVFADIPEKFRGLFEKISGLLDSLKGESSSIKLMPLQEQVDRLELDLTDFVFLSHIADNALQDKDLFVCVGGDHADFLAKAFDTLGYAHIKSLGDYDDEDLIKNIDSYAINLKEALKSLS